MYLSPFSNNLWKQCKKADFSANTICYTYTKIHSFILFILRSQQFHFIELFYRIQTVAMLILIESKNIESEFFPLFSCILIQ